MAVFHYQERDHSKVSCVPPIIILSSFAVLAIFCITMLINDGLYKENRINKCIEYCAPHRVSMCSDATEPTWVQILNKDVGDLKIICSSEKYEILKKDNGDHK